MPIHPTPKKDAVIADLKPDAQDQSLIDGYCQVSSVMGVIDLYQAEHYCGRLFWAVLLFLCVLSTGYGIFGNIR